MKRAVTVAKITDRHAEGPDSYPPTLTPAERLELLHRLSIEFLGAGPPGRGT
jgi:hypothetical protein